MKKMEKKAYVTPNCEVVEVEITMAILTSSPTEQPGTDVEENTPEDMGANRHRGSWGNLWD